MDSATGVVIVAIPSENDYVWRISSEKVPHLTLCFLGDVTDTAQLGRIEEYLGHVVETSMHTFGMNVDYRGELGDNKADVLFFEDKKMLERVRGYLLANPDISKAYNAAQQYEEWTPHLTLGYPATPAKPDKRDYPGISWVNFDRVALWPGDYTGPEFRLDDRETYDDVFQAHSDIKVRDLAHFGKKGMKWGVSKTHEHTARTLAKDASKTAGAVGAARSTKSQTKVAFKTKVKTAGGLHAVSDKELKSMLSRLDMESKYSKIVNEDAAKRAEGRKAVLKFLGGVGKIALPLIVGGLAVKTAAANVDNIKTYAHLGRRVLTSR